MQSNRQRGGVGLGEFQNFFGELRGWIFRGEKEGREGSWCEGREGREREPVDGANGTAKNPFS
jgi:hypothetical protein